MHENIMKDIRNAEKCGMSYGHFKALQNEINTALKESKTGSAKHFGRVVKRLEKTLRTAEEKR